MGNGVGARMNYPYDRHSASVGEMLMLEMRGESSSRVSAGVGSPTSGTVRHIEHNSG